MKLCTCLTCFHLLLAAESVWHDQVAAEVIGMQYRTHTLIMLDIENALMATSIKCGLIHQANDHLPVSTSWDCLSFMMNYFILQPLEEIHTQQNNRSIRAIRALICISKSLCIMFFSCKTWDVYFRCRHKS